MVLVVFFDHIVWYTHGMKTTIDKGGRVVIPAPIRAKLGLSPGTELEIVVEDFSVVLMRAAPRPKLVRVGKRLVARPTAPPDDRSAVDISQLIEEERSRWP
jgi:AbrB family looped-hinge helix DNA binding protein